jgi:hypothetical protein
MRKTARPVVWEGDGAEFPVTRPDQFTQTGCVGKVGGIVQNCLADFPSYDAGSTKTAVPYASTSVTPFMISVAS